MIFTIRGDPFDFGGVRALRAGEGLVKNSFQSVFLGLYVIPHANKCQAQMIFMDFNLSIRLRAAGPTKERIAHCGPNRFESQGNELQARQLLV